MERSVNSRTTELHAAHSVEAMGYVHASIELSNPREPGLRPIQTRALADSGALMLCIPEHLALELKLQTESLREVTVAYGRSMTVPYVGPSRWSLAIASALSEPWCSERTFSWEPSPWRIWI